MRQAKTEPRAFSTLARGLSLPADERGVHPALAGAWERHRRNLSHVNPKTR